MPCDIGLRNVVTVKVEVPVAKNLRVRVKPEEIDLDLLEKLGEEDNEFVNWLGSLDTKPVLEEALKRTLAYLGYTKNYTALSKDGYLEVSGKYTTFVEKKEIEKRANDIGRRFQIETLNAVAQILGYETAIVFSKDGSFKIEGEREGELGVHKYLAISGGADGNGDLRFEHFATKKDMRTETSKFLALAGKFGVKLAVECVEEAGKESGETVFAEETEKGRVN